MPMTIAVKSTRSDNQPPSEGSQLRKRNFPCVLFMNIAVKDWSPEAILTEICVDSSKKDLIVIRVKEHFPEMRSMIPAETS
jgi:hypothetical protein